MGEVGPRAHGAVQLGGFLLIALWSLLLPGGLPRGETVAAFRLFRCITFAEFKVQVLQSAECSVGLVMWQFSGAAASRRTRAMAHSWWHCVGASGSREQNEMRGAGGSLCSAKASVTCSRLCLNWAKRSSTI